MSTRWATAAAALATAALALLCASCDSEATVNPTRGGTPPTQAVKPAPTTRTASPEIVFGEEFERIRIEAEDAVTMEGNLKEKVQIEEAEGASGGKCLYIPDKVGTPKEGKFFSAQYKFTVKKAGLYTFWCRRKWCDPPQCGDTFVVRFDQVGKPRDLKREPLFGSDDMSRPPRWGWSPVYQNGKPRQFFLAAGEHVMEILNAEDGPRCDALLLTNDRDYVPQGMED